MSCRFTAMVSKCTASHKLSYSACPIPGLCGIRSQRRAGPRLGQPGLSAAAQWLAGEHPALERLRLRLLWPWPVSTAQRFSVRTCLAAFLGVSEQSAGQCARINGWGELAQKPGQCVAGLDTRLAITTSAECALHTHTHTHISQVVSAADPLVYRKALHVMQLRLARLQPSKLLTQLLQPLLKFLWPLPCEGPCPCHAACGPVHCDASRCQVRTQASQIC